MASDTCEVCGRNIVVAINKGTGICSEWCRKIKNGEMSTDAAVKHLISISPPGQRTPWEIEKGKAAGLSD